MWLAELPPFVPFYIAALLAGLTRGRIRMFILLAAPLLGGLQLLGIEPGVELQTRFLGYELMPFRVDKLSLLFGYLCVVFQYCLLVFACCFCGLSLLVLAISGSSCGQQYCCCYWVHYFTFAYKIQSTPSGVYCFILPSTLKPKCLNRI